MLLVVLWLCMSEERNVEIGAVWNPKEWASSGKRNGSVREKQCWSFLTGHFSAYGQGAFHNISHISSLGCVSNLRKHITPVSRCLRFLWMIVPPWIFRAWGFSIHQKPSGHGCSATWSNCSLWSPSPAGFRINTYQPVLTPSDQNLWTTISRRGLLTATISTSEPVLCLLSHTRASRTTCSLNS